MTVRRVCDFLLASKILRIEPILMVIMITKRETDTMSSTNVNPDTKLTLFIFNGIRNNKSIFCLITLSVWVNPLFLLLCVSTLHGIAPWHDRLMTLKKYLYLYMKRPLFHVRL